MSTPRFSRIQKATTIIPLALLSCAWTASLAGVGVGVGVSSIAGVSTAAAQETPSVALPDGTDVPTEAIEAPASVSTHGKVAPGVSGNTKSVVAKSSTSGIPSVALAAYQRAETVINAADKSCKLPWQLVAAIGRVESDHGRTNGNTLNDKGIARPGIFGVALNGKHSTQNIVDTDAGQYDSDTKFDRAVGPMQFIPSTWSVVGVDADGDGQRNPQDINDAALATAVYLCSGDDNLSKEAGQRAAVLRYNHSQSYVSLVLSIMNAYMDGDFTSVPNSTTSAGYFVPDPHPVKQTPIKQNQPSQQDQGTPSTGNTQAPATQPTNTPAPQPTNPPAPAPTNPGGNDGGGNGGGGNGGGNGGGTPVPTPTLPPVPTPTDPPVDEVLTLAQAIAQCTLEGYVDNPLSSNDNFDKCVAGYTK